MTLPFQSVQFCSVLILIIILNVCENVRALTVDNQLISVQNDCFERIAFGAMLPLEKAYRMDDMNLLSRCQELCLREGEKCQTLAFGIHASRNGTCQLSGDKIAPTNSQPVGTIFDPDFDLYSRKTNCFELPASNEIPSSSNSGTTPLNDGTRNRPPPPPYGTVSTSLGPPSTQSSGYPTSTTVDDRFSVRPADDNTRYPSTGTAADNNKYSPISSGAYDVNEIPSDRNYPVTRRPTTIYPGTDYEPSYNGGYSDSNRDKIYFSHGSPLYTNQMLYETNYPMPNDPSIYPGVYAENVATVNDRYKPPSVDPYRNQQKPTVRPIYGMGYGNGYSYGTPEPNRLTSLRPNQDRPSTSINSGEDNAYPGTNYRPSTRPETDRNGYPTPRPEYGPPKRPAYGTNDRPADNGYDSRPDLPYDSSRPLTSPGTSYGSSQNTPTRPATYGPTSTDQQRPQDSTGYGGQSRPQDNQSSTKPYSPSTPFGPTKTQESQGNGYDNLRPNHLPGSDYVGGTSKPNDHQPGYGSGSVRPNNYNGYNGGTTRPQDQPGSGYGSGSTRPQDQPGGSGYGSGSTRPQDQPGGSGYGTRPEQPGSTYSSSIPTRPANQPGSQYGNDNPIRRPSDPQRPDSGSYGSKPPPGNYNDNGNDPRIETYFNPDDYIESKWTTKPGNYPTSHHGGSSSGSGYSNDQRYPSMDACFRRVLAGKRIAPHWIQRTLACERVDDCMRECGHEKRFQCEGFNYRLDPSGHGQGECELAEIPLAQMDLYSSTHSRDSNLLRHPDYDYYERDRNAPSSCRQSCKDCTVIKPLSSPPLYFRPSGYDKPYYHDEHYPVGPSSSGYGSGGPPPPPERFRPSSTAIDKYRPAPPVYESRPDDYHHYDFSSQSHHESGSYHRPGGSYGGDRIDRYDVVRPDDSFRPGPDRWQAIPSSHGGSSYGGDIHSRPVIVEHVRPDNDRPDHFRPAFRPGPEYSPYGRPAPPPPQHHYGETDDRYGALPPPSSHGYLDRDRSIYRKPSDKFIPYLIGSERDWGSYGGSYGGSSSGHKNSDYWGIRNENRRKDSSDFNYFDLGGSRHLPYSPIDNSIYPGSRYGDEKSRHPPPLPPNDRHYEFGNQWTRRPGPDECSVKSSEGFRLHKGAIRNSHTVPTITECEKLCSAENKFICHTYSYRYSTVGRENCLLCDRPVNLLDYYVDIEPDRNYDIYSMSDEHNSCVQPHHGGSGSGGGGGSSTALSDPRNNAQCFFRAIDGTRFFKSIVRDSLTVRSIGQCELECIKSLKFSCRAFAYRYGQRTQGGIIDNCQLSDWPVRDMDKGRHLIVDPSFDVFERASYGHGCEIQPIVDDKHKKLCYLGYGSAAKLLAPAIKKVISVQSEVECKKECIRLRENSQFKCYSFSYGSQASTFNCEMSDLDQSELKLNIHYAHVTDRDYWLFAWNPFDWTCRDKVATIGGNRVNNDRRMDIFREPGDVTWRHYTVLGKPCRVGSGCDKNLVTGFYSCETDGGEIGSWDYCCKSDYPCGYSKGFDYPWCFVGDEPDQWRKCSDRYYPSSTDNYHLNSTKIHSQPTKNSINRKPPQDQYQRPPRPGGLQSLTDFAAARLWPVTYLYSEGPPNSTELSNFVDCNKETC